jgi:hypothetical protein
MQSISDKGNQVGREAPSAAVGPCWAGQADQAPGPVACPPPSLGTLRHASIGGHPGQRYRVLDVGRRIRHRCSACDR